MGLSLKNKHHSKFNLILEGGTFFWARGSFDPDCGSVLLFSILYLFHTDYPVIPEKEINISGMFTPAPPVKYSSTEYCEFPELCTKHCASLVICNFISFLINVH